MILDLQAEADEQESAVELSKVIEEQREQLEHLKKERDASKQRLENGRRDLLYNLGVSIHFKK